MMDKKICILSFSPIRRDARVLREIKGLSPYYDLTVIGYEGPHPDWTNDSNINWHSLGNLETLDHSKDPGERASRRRQGFNELFGVKQLTKFIKYLVQRIRVPFNYLAMFSGGVCHSVYEYWYWKQPRHVKAFELASQSSWGIIHANDWEALPVAAEAAKARNAKVIFDAHEYAPLELEHRRLWKIIYKPAVIYFIRKYASQVNASITVAPLISERYREEFGLSPIVVLNAPEREPIRHRSTMTQAIRLVHHGGAFPDRRLEKMIETLSFCDPRFELHFLLVASQSGYLDRLKKLAKKRTPGRIFFHDPVAPEKIVSRISEYDMGFYLLESNSYNNRVALPNKFFDFIIAGLAVCIGPSVSMAEMVRRYGFGVVAPSFNPQEVAETLNHVSQEQLTKMKTASMEAAMDINGQKEMNKLVVLYAQLLQERPS